MYVVCSICGKEVVNAVGRQKYHTRCRRAYHKNRFKTMPREEKLRLARAELMGREASKKQAQCKEERCAAFRRTGEKSGVCLFPHCVQERWAF